MAGNGKKPKKAPKKRIGTARGNGKNGVRAGPNRQAGEKGPPVWPPTRMTKKKKEGVVRSLAQCFKPAAVCYAHGISYESFRKHRLADPEFAAAVEEAKQQYRSLIMGTVHDRAIIGWEEPVFGSLGQGQGTGEVGKIRRYDHKLLLALAKYHDPGWRDRLEVDQKTEHTGFVAGAMALADLSEEGRGELRRLLLAEKERRALVQEGEGD